MPIRDACRCRFLGMHPQAMCVAAAQMLGQLKTEEDEAAWDKKVAALNEELLLWDAHLSEGYAAGKEFTLAGARMPLAPSKPTP